MFQRGFYLFMFGRLFYQIRVKNTNPESFRETGSVEPAKWFNCTPRRIHLDLGIAHDKNLCLWVRL